jgi:hypothetical protein
MQRTRVNPPNEIKVRVPEPLIATIRRRSKS